MELKYENSAVRKFFTDFNLMAKCKGHDLARAVKKRCDQMRAAHNFGVYLGLGIGQPHPLVDDLKGYYAIRLTGKDRLIVKPMTENLAPEFVNKCDVVIIEGVMNYHGNKKEWIIP